MFLRESHYPPLVGEQSTKPRRSHRRRAPLILDWLGSWELPRLAAPKPVVPAARFARLFGLLGSTDDSDRIPPKPHGALTSQGTAVRVAADYWQRLGSLGNDRAAQTDALVDARPNVLLGKPRG
jgi:hypothetical protein